MLYLCYLVLINSLRFILLSKIKAGAYPDSPVSQRLCRSSYISEIYLPSSTMEIQLVSDEYNNGRGFKIEYSTQDSYSKEIF